MEILNLPLSNGEIELDLLWSRQCIISEISTPGVAGDADTNPTVQPMAAI